jgi:hypothetical protein
MKFPGAAGVTWDHQSSFMSIQMSPAARREKSVTLHLAPREWLRFLNDARR